MARGVVGLYHGWEEAHHAEARFDSVHRDREMPNDVAEVELPPAIAAEEKVWLPKLLAAAGLAASNSEGRRLIEGGGVRVDGEPVTDPQLELGVAELPGKVLQVGRRFRREQIGRQPDEVEVTVRRDPIVGPHGSSSVNGAL